MRKIIFTFIALLCINIGVLVLVCLLGTLPFIQRGANLVNDTITYRLQYLQNKHDDTIAIIAIDERTLQQIGKSDLGMLAFDKGVYAELVEKVFRQYQAAVLGIDIIFATPSVLGRADEEKLKDALERYKDSVVIATRSDYNPHPLCVYSGIQHAAIDTLNQEQIRVFSYKNFPYQLKKVCPKANIHPNNRESISSLPAKLVDMYQQILNPFQREKIQKNLAQFSQKDEKNNYIDYYTNYTSHTGTLGYDNYSFIDIYKGESHTPDGKKIDLKNKIIFVGEVGTLLHDAHLTPVHPSIKMPGVEINANIANTLMQGRHLQKAPFILSIFLLFILQFVLMGASVSLRTLVSFAVMLACIGALCIFGAWMFVLGEIYNVFLGILGLCFSYLGAFLYRFHISDKAKRRLKKQFSSYVSPDVVNEISKNPDSILTKGEKRELSIFFSDIVSFTSISENTDPERIVKMLNEYFSEMTQIIHKNKGTLDKYIGDAVMCFFNAPIKQDNHSYYACLTALEQQKKLRELNIAWAKKGYPEIKIRIGLHTGEAIHGNIGKSDTRVSYTLIGDSVNLASRLEGICKMYGVSICSSQEVYTLQKDFFHFRELDVISVKGRKKPVKIYQLIASKKQRLSQKHCEYLDRYSQALAYYKTGDFQKAETIFSKNIGDKASYIMQKRCKDIQDGKYNLNQGIFEMQSK